MLEEISNNSEATMSYMEKDQKKKKDYREHLLLLEDSSEVIYGNFYNK